MDRKGEDVPGVDMSKLNIRVRVEGGGIDKYPAKTHARRVAERLNVEDGLIALSATKAANWPNSDMPAPFRQDRYFYYLTGCNEPGTFVTYDIKADKLILWLPPIDKARVLWCGRGSTVEEALEKYDIDAAHYIKAREDDDDGDMGGFWKGKVPDVVNDPQAPHEMYCRSFDHEICHEDLSLFQQGSGHLWGWETVNPPVIDLRKCSDKHPPLKHAIDACRVVKDQHEVNLVRKANAITAEAHTSVFKSMHAFKNEAEVEAAYTQVCISRKAKEQAYDPIAGSGANAAELHYSENDADFGKGQTFVLDAGCEVERYASDVTRTFPINYKKPGHWPSEEAKDIYKLVEDIQESCIKLMQPGKVFVEIFWHSHEMVIEGLLKLGIFKAGNSVKDIFRAGTSRAFLPHGLGHHVGLEVHDVAPTPPPPAWESAEQAEIQHTSSVRKAFSSWRPETTHEPDSFSWVLEHVTFQRRKHSTSPSLSSVSAPVLEPGMIVTIEPGIYFNKYLLDNFFLNDPKHVEFIDLEVLDRYMQVGGVRIEDDILITEDGYENLTTAPKGEEMLRIMREGAKTAGVSR